MRSAAFEQILFVVTILAYTSLAAPTLLKASQRRTSNNGQLILQVSPKINNEGYLVVRWDNKLDESTMQFYSDKRPLWTNGIATTGIALQGVTFFESGDYVFARPTHQSNTKSFPDSYVRCQFYQQHGPVDRIFGIGEQMNVPSKANAVMCRAYQPAKTSSASTWMHEDNDDGPIYDVNNQFQNNELFENSNVNDGYSNQYQQKESLYPERKWKEPSYNVRIHDENIGDNDPYSSPSDDSSDNPYFKPYDNPYSNPNDDSFNNPYDEPYTNPYEDPYSGDPYNDVDNGLNDLYGDTGTDSNLFNDDYNGFE